MASTLCTHAENRPTELGHLESLIRLYEREKELYGEILELSREQVRLIDAGRNLGEIRALLQRKTRALDTIARLEAVHGPARSVWERKRHVLTGEIPATLQRQFTEIGALIEEILGVEADSDRLLIAAAGR